MTADGWAIAIVGGGALLYAFADEVAAYREEKADEKALEIESIAKRAAWMRELDLREADRRGIAE